LLRVGWHAGVERRVGRPISLASRFQRIDDATATSRIAASIGLTEADFDTDWSEHLTDASSTRFRVMMKRIKVLSRSLVMDHAGVEPRQKAGLNSIPCREVGLP